MGHTDPEVLVVLADHGDQGYLVLPGLRLVLGFRLYRNQAYRPDLREGQFSVRDYAPNGHESAL